MKADVPPLWSQINESMTELLDRVRKSVVQVINKQMGAGSGFVIHADGLILTNAHVVHRKYPQVRLFDGEIMHAHVVSCDDSADLALLQVETRGLSPLSWSRTKVRPGDWVAAVGHPRGIRDTSTAGIIVEIGRQSGVDHLSQREWLVVDLHLAPGSSGGPLVNTAGEVIGVNTMLTANGHGIAVPASEAEAFVAHVV